LKRLLPFLLSALPLAAAAQSYSPTGSGLPSAAVPKTTQVLVIETPKQGVTFPQVFAVMPREARATVKVYLDGKIREWYSRGDGKGVVFLVDAKSVEDAREIIESLPLTKEQLVDSQYIPVGPLVPLRVLVGPGAQQ
jgi:peptidyl-tRNA hydrolase